MEKLLNVHGAKKVVNDEFPTFLDGEEDDDLEFEEDMFDEQPHEDHHEHEVDYDDDEYETEILSIKDVETGENLKFTVDGEDYDRIDMELLDDQQLLNPDENVKTSESIKEHLQKSKDLGYLKSSVDILQKGSTQNAKNIEKLLNSF